MPGRKRASSVPHSIASITASSLRFQPSHRRAPGSLRCAVGAMLRISESSDFRAQHSRYRARVLRLPWSSPSATHRFGRRCMANWPASLSRRYLPARAARQAARARASCRRNGPLSNEPVPRQRVVRRRLALQTGSEVGAVDPEEVECEERGGILDGSAADARAALRGRGGTSGVNILESGAQKVPRLWASSIVGPSAGDCRHAQASRTHDGREWSAKKDEVAHFRRSWASRLGCGCGA